MPVFGLYVDDAYTFREKSVSQLPIYSFEDFSSSCKNFVLGVSKGQNNDIQYYFYIKDEYGGFKITKVNSSVCSIVKTNIKNPYMKIINKTWTFKSAAAAFLWGPNLRALTFPDEKYYVLYVPFNTVKKNVN